MYCGLFLAAHFRGMPVFAGQGHEKREKSRGTEHLPQWTLAGRLLLLSPKGAWNNPTCAGPQAMHTHTHAVIVASKAGPGGSAKVNTPKRMSPIQKMGPRGGCAMLDVECTEYGGQSREPRQVRGSPAVPAR